MEAESFELAKDVLGCTYTAVARERRLPDEGWSSLEVKQLLMELAAADANCQHGQVSVGEREGRVYSELVRDRHFHFSHGIGRSGDIFALQPKAVGSSLLYKLAAYLSLHAIKICGIQSTARCLPVPLATGMSLSLCLTALHSARPTKDLVIVSRIDQKSCLKAVAHAGLKLRVVDQRINPDGSLETDIDGIEKVMEDEADRVLCIMSTTSAFAPRQPDLVPQISKLCMQRDIYHLVNNAYGLQCSKCCSLVEQGCRQGRVDLVVSSCDKNFMTPVGGALIYSPISQFVSRVSESYPGRANMSPILDLFITLLQMGRLGLQKLLQERKRLFGWFEDELSAKCEALGLRLLPSPRNKISIAIDLSGLEGKGTQQQDPGRAASFLGSQLFLRRCSGLRVVVPTDEETVIAGVPLRSFGSHCVYPAPYCSLACAIGADEGELRLFLQRFSELVTDTKKARAAPS